jgi:hypothetical protein
MARRSHTQDLIAQLLEQQATPNEQVAARFPTDLELGLPDQASMDRYIASINGREGFPNFNWVNPAGVEAFLANAPESENIEDRRPDPDAFIRSVLAR